jgi:hypothetical protein
VAGIDELRVDAVVALSPWVIAGLPHSDAMSLAVGNRELRADDEDAVRPRKLAHAGAVSGLSPR